MDASEHEMLRCIYVQLLATIRSYVQSVDTQVAVSRVQILDSLQSLYNGTYSIPMIP